MENQQQYLMQLQMLEQEANQFGEQLKMVGQQIKELSTAKENLIQLRNSTEKEMFAEFGKGIYFKGNLEQGDLLVDVGNKILVPKKVEEVEKIIDLQISKFKEVEVEIGKRIEMINQQVNQVMGEVSGGTEKKVSKKKASKKKVVAPKGVPSKEGKK